MASLLHEASDSDTTSPFLQTENDEDDRLDTLDNQHSQSATVSSPNQAGSLPSTDNEGGFASLSVSSLIRLTSTNGVDHNQNNMADFSTDSDVSVQENVQTLGKDGENHIVHNESLYNITNNINGHLNKSKGKEPDSNNSTPRASVMSPPRAPKTPQGDFVGSASKMNVDDVGSVKSGFNRNNRNEGPNNERWVSKRKHFFVLSSAGKPIYSRYGDESKLSSYMGVIQAILSFFASDDDILKCINAGAHRFVFASRGPLYLVAISTTGESESQLREQLQYLYNQILFILTGAQLARIFEQRINYDLRNLLAGTENLMDELANSFQMSPSHFLSAIHPLRMSQRLRSRIGGIMSEGLPKSLAFGLIMAKERLVTLIRPKSHSLHLSDFLLVINLLSASPGMKSAESWTPVCLPRFNPRNHLHIYVCYVARDVAMVLVGPDRDAFFEFSEYKSKAVKMMTDQGCFEGLEEAIKKDPYSLDEIEIPAIRHFIFKSRALVQYTQPGPSPPYTNKEDWRRLLLLYQHAHSKLYKRLYASKVVFNVGSAESILAVATSTHELYVSFSPLITKTVAVAAANGLQKWVQKWEQGLFLTKAPLF